MQDMKEQIRLSGLVLGNNQEEPQWITKPFGLCKRWLHALVVIHAPYNEKEEIIVVLGGFDPSSDATRTRSVFLFNGDGSRRKQQPRGPRMNERRVGHAGVVCNGRVYAIGGGNNSNPLDTIECIDVIDLLHPSAHLNKTEKKTPWKTLKCRLSTTQQGSCSAAVVQNRYIVIAGAARGENVDIVDVSQASQPFIFQGPSMTVPRCKFGMAAIGSRVFVIGGYNKMTGGEEQSPSVEYLDLSTDSGNHGSDFQESTLASSLSWKMHKDLVLSVPRVGHSVVRVGSCLVVVGGRFPIKNEAGDRVVIEEIDANLPVEVLDTKRNKVWSLPDLRHERGELGAAVAVSNEIVVVGGDMRFCKTSERIPLMDKNSAVYKRLLDRPVVREFE